MRYLIGSFFVLAHVAIFYFIWAGFVRTGSAHAHQTEEKIMDSEIFIHCEQPWLGLIQSGVKKIEGRKKAKKYTDLNPGDMVIFHDEQTSFKARIVKVVEYKTLEDYLICEGINNALPGISNLDEGISIYGQWSTPEQLKNGFLAIHVDINL